MCVTTVGMITPNRLRSLHRISCRCVLIWIGLAGFGVATVHPETNRATIADNAATRLPRVVVLADEADLEALLVVNLAEVEILERKELPRVSSEQLLADGDLRLAGADIALVVDRADGRGVLRVVDCKTGAVVVVLEMPAMPVAEAVRWLSVRARPFLNLAADADRPRVSLAGLRFVTDSAENRAAERALNLVLTARLQAGGAVVLERWRMGDLVFEKTLGADEGPFWNAARLVDGSVNTKQGRLSSRVRVRDAAGVESLWEVAAGSAEELAEAITAKILQSTEVGMATPGASLENSRVEAEAFLAEAKWMLAHGLPREAWQATESALALGMTPRREAEMLRVQAAAMCAYPDDLRTSGYGQDGGYRVRAFESGDLSERVAAATEAVLLAGDYWNAYSLKEPPRRWLLEHPDSLCIRTLYTGLRVLRGAHDLGWAKENSDAIQRLRGAIRRNVALMENGALGNQRTTFLIYLTNYAGYWSETPIEAVNFYRKVLHPDFDAGLKTWPEAIRGELAYDAKPHPPFLTGTAPREDFPFGSGSWRVIARDEDSARAAWADYLDELAHSPMALNRADGLALRWQSTADKRARISLAAEMVDFMSDHMTDLAGPHGYAIFSQFIEPFRHAARSTDFSGKQENLIRAFASLVRSESAVSPKIFGSAWALFENNHVKIHENLAREVLDALEARRARPSISAEDLSGIDSALSSVWKKFPSLRLIEESEGTITSRSLWIAAEHAPDDLRGHIGFSAETAVWQGGRLWVLDPHHGRLWEIDPRSGHAVIHSPMNRPKADFGSQLIGWDKRLAVTAERGVWVLDEKRERWTRVDLPPARHKIGVAHDHLWVVSGEAIRTGSVKQIEGNALYRVSPNLAVELVASSRRRPSVDALDAKLSGEPFAVFPSVTGGVIIGAYGQNWTFIDSVSATSAERPGKRFIGNIQPTSSPGLLARHGRSAGDRNRLMRVELFSPKGVELLLTHPSLDQSGQALFPYTQELVDLPASYYSVAWSEGGLEILAWSSRGSPWGASEAWLARIDAEGCLINPLRFEWPVDGDQRARASGHEPSVMRYPHPDAKGLIATDDGLVITGRGMLGFWFIPKEQLEARRLAMRAAKAKSRAE